MATTGRKLVLGSAFRVTNLVTAAVVSFFMMPFVVHALGDRMYGVWTLVATYIGYYGLLDLGFSSAVTRYLAGALGTGDNERYNQVFNTAFLVFCGIGFTAMVLTVGLALAVPWFARSPQDASLFRELILVLGLNLAVGFPLRAVVGALNAQLRYDIVAAIDLVSLVLRTILIIVVILAGYKVVGLAWATTMGSLVGMVFYVVAFKKNLPFVRLDPRYWGKETAKSLFSYSSYSFIVQIADLVRFQVDALIVGGLVGLAAVTHYNIAGTLAQHFIYVMIALMGVFSPVFSQQEGAQEYDALKRTFFFASKISVCTSSFIAFGLVAWGKPFIERWMGARFLDAYPSLVVLTLGCMFALWQNPSVTLLYSTSKHKFFALFNSVEAISNLILSLVLVRRYGILGVALGTCIPMAITKLFIQPQYVCRVSSISYSEYLQRMGKSVALVCLSLVVPSLITARFVTASYMSLVSLGVISLVLYAIPLWFLEFSRRETEMLQQALLPRTFLKRTAQSGGRM